MMKARLMGVIRATRLTSVNPAETEQTFPFAARFKADFLSY